MYGSYGYCWDRWDLIVWCWDLVGTTIINVVGTNYIFVGTICTIAVGTCRYCWDLTVSCWDLVGTILDVVGSKDIFVGTMYGTCGCCWDHWDLTV